MIPTEKYFIPYIASYVKVWYYRAYCGCN